MEAIVLAKPFQEGWEIQLHRPKKMNALNEAMLEALNKHLEEGAHKDPPFLFLTGSGRFFCFGADVKELRNHPESLPRLLPLFQRIILRLWTFPSPTMAIFNGHAAGAGLDLALACDFRIAHPGVKLSEAFVQWGLVPDGGGTYQLPRLIGYQRAKYLALLGEPITAETAYAWGLVDEVVPKEQLEEAKNQWAKRYLNLSREAYRAIRQLLRENLHRSFEEALEEEKKAQLLRWKEIGHV